MKFKAYGVLLLILMASIPLFGRTKHLENYDEIVRSLMKGEPVRVVIRYGDCDLIVDGVKMESSPNAAGGMSLDTFEWFAAGLFGNNPAYVVASKSVLIENPIGDGYVYNYVKIRIHENGQVHVIARYLDPENYEILMDEMFETTINNRNNKGAADFFAVK